VTVVAQEDTRTRILAVALELIAEHGYAGTSTRQVCERMGFTKAALFYHFPAKSALLEALAAPVLRDLEALGATPVSAGTAARGRVVARYVHLVVTHADVMRVLYDDPSTRNQDALKALRPLYERLFRLLCGTESPSAAELARARAVAGAVHAALLRAAPEHEPGILLSAALSAGCGALGVPLPRAQQPATTPSHGGSS